MKANQPSLLEAIEVLFAAPSLSMRKAYQRDRHGSRSEHRRLRASSELNDYLDWPGLAQVLEIRRETRNGRGETSTEVRYAITSQGQDQAGPSRLLQLVRGHWSIENRLHYVRDVTLSEDRCTVRTEAAPYAMAALRNGVLGLLRGRKAKNIAAALRRNAGRPRAIMKWIAGRRE